MAIYTKTGDRGDTGNLKTRLSKASCQIAAIGSLDELNSFLGIIGGAIDIQRDLFCVNAILAGAHLSFSKSKITRLEKEIDKLEGTLPVLKNFILYGGANRAAQLFYARALTRRAERSLVALAKIQKINPNILAFVNRLSDYLFMKAREANQEEGIKEEIWKP